MSRREPTAVYVESAICQVGANSVACANFMTFAEHIKSIMAFVALPPPARSHVSFGDNNFADGIVKSIA